MSDQNLKICFHFKALELHKGESAYDRSEIEKFTSSIKLIQILLVSHYLPWKIEIIGRLPNNFHSSKIIAQKVSNNTKQNLDNDYFKIFNDQLKLYIFEKNIQCSQKRRTVKMVLLNKRK